VGREETVMKGWPCQRRAGQSLRKPSVIGTAPIKTVLKQSDRRMQFAHDPLIISGRGLGDRCGGNLHVRRRISVFVELLVSEVSPDKMAIVFAQDYFRLG